MAHWDVFHSDRLEVERGLTTAAVLQAHARGEILDDDLLRPAGTTAPWVRLADMPPLAEPEPEPAVALKPIPPAPSRSPFEEVEFEIPERAEVIEPPLPIFARDDDEEDEDEEDDEPADFPPAPSSRHAAPYREQHEALRAREDDAEAASSLELLIWDDDLDEDDDAVDPQDEDEAAAEFTLSRHSADKVEELDLAAMVDVAFQLVLFFLVTATTILYKSLEVPKPSPENAPAAAQGRSRSLDDLKDTHILVEIDPSGAVKIDREPVPAEMPALIERLRAARAQTDRNSMLLSADFSTPHRSAVLAYDAANEIGLSIAIARPAPPPIK